MTKTKEDSKSPPTDVFTDVSLRKKSFKGITLLMREFLWQFPNSSPKEVCRVLYDKYKIKCKERGISQKLFYHKYKHMVSVEKYRLNEWRKTEIKGRLPSSLVSSHRVEWSIEQPLSMPVLSTLSLEAEKRKPRRRDPKPVGVWYVIPNRNRMREYHDKHVTVRIFPKSGTVRVLPGHPMAWPDLKGYVESAFLMGGLVVRECERLAEQLVPSTRHKTFQVGPVTPFKIDHYRDALGLTISVNGSHPEHIETREDWPSWIKPILNAVARQIEAANRQAEANLQQAEASKEFARQIELHLSVMSGIGNSVMELSSTVKKLDNTAEKLMKNQKVIAYATSQKVVGQGQQGLHFTFTFSELRKVEQLLSVEFDTDPEMGIIRRHPPDKTYAGNVVGVSTYLAVGTTVTDNVNGTTLTAKACAVGF